MLRDDDFRSELLGARHGGGDGSEWIRRRWCLSVSTYGGSKGKLAPGIVLDVFKKRSRARQSDFMNACSWATLGLELTCDTLEKFMPIGACTFDRANPFETLFWNIIDFRRFSQQPQTSKAQLPTDSVFYTATARIGRKINAKSRQLVSASTLQACSIMQAWVYKLRTRPWLKKYAYLAPSPGGRGGRRSLLIGGPPVTVGQVSIETRSATPRGVREDLD